MEDAGLIRFDERARERLSLQVPIWRKIQAVIAEEFNFFEVIRF
jgi:hypothetical protein